MDNLSTHAICNCIILVLVVIIVILFFQVASARKSERFVAAYSTYAVDDSPELIQAYNKSLKKLPEGFSWGPKGGVNYWGGYTGATPSYTEDLEAAQRYGMDNFINMYSSGNWAPKNL